MKKMKFERKQARKERAEPKDAPMEPPTVESAEPVAEEVIEAAPVAVKEKPVRPQRKKDPAAQIAAYVKSFDWGRVRATAQRAIASGGLQDEQVDQIIDSALPSFDELKNAPLNKIMAAASAASPEKMEEYRPLLEFHASHAKSLPEKERGEMDDHMQLLGMLQAEPQQEMMNA
jgi:hypothetical protein